VPVGDILACEYRQGDLLTLAELEDVVRRSGVAPTAKVITSRLITRGWLVTAGPRGVYTFEPEPVRTVPSRPDSVVALRAALMRRPELRAALTFRSAAWAFGLADHAGARLEIAAATPLHASALASVGRPFVFGPRLDPRRVHGLPVLQPESVLVHAAAKPGEVRHWAVALGWLPPLAAAIRWDVVREELVGRSRPALVRLGYLLSGVRPDIAEALRPAVGARVLFGTKGRVRRVDHDWEVADALLPISPRLLDPAPVPA
jgi:AbiEi antitoxin C-terminal domain